jgi:hypothetical protein
MILCQYAWVSDQAVFSGGSRGGLSRVAATSWPVGALVSLPSIASYCASAEGVVDP